MDNLGYVRISQYIQGQNNLKKLHDLAPLKLCPKTLVVAKRTLPTSQTLRQRSRPRPRQRQRSPVAADATLRLAAAPSQPEARRLKGVLACP
jgi:hypothetical protein